MTAILTVQEGGLVFGCLRAYDTRGESAVIVIYEDTRNRHVDIMPYPGDSLLCKKMHSHVYVPLFRIIKTNLCMHQTNIPDDILIEYFPIYECLRHGEILRQCTPDSCCV